MWTALALFSVVVAVAVGQTPDAFTRIDVDKDSHLTLSEFDKFYDSFDNDGDGHLSLADYVTATKLPEAQAKPLFNEYDTNKDGDITKSDVAAIFKKIDTNDNQAITKGEMDNFLKGLSAVFNVGK